MRLSLAKRARTIIENCPTDGTMSDQDCLRRFCSEFRLGLDGHDHAIMNAVRKLAADIERTRSAPAQDPDRGVGLRDVKHIAHLMSTYDALIAASADSSWQHAWHWIDRCFEYLLRYLRRYDNRAA